ncbi:MAG: hypothetical protein ACKVQB_12560 [Bacteroidia bacterium]
MPNRVKIASTVLFIFFLKTGFCQDIYDSTNSRRFADYLFKSKEYGRAALEYERSCFLDSQNWSSHFYLMQSYRKSGQASKGMDDFNRVNRRLPQQEFYRFQHEKNICVFIAQPKRFISYTEKDSMAELPFFKVPALLLTHNWEASKLYLTEVNYLEDKTLTKYYNNCQQALQLNYKKPWLAGTMSTLVPGLGKVYTGYYKDGIVALLFTGMSAYQAYRGYKAKGTKSGIFIIYTGMTAGFYFGNIYGSIKSARIRNRKMNEKIDSKTKEIFYEWAE